MNDTQASDRPRKAIGPDRLTYLNADDVDRVMAVVLALISETASIRERLDTHERIAAAGAVATPDAVEAHRADPQAEAAREVWRDGYIRRLFRVFTEDVEALDRSAADPATGEA